MTNQVYNKWVGKIISDRLASIDVKVVLINVSGAGTLYAFSQTHEFLSDVPVASRISTTTANLSSKTFVDGMFDAANLVPAFPSVTGTESEALGLFEDTGDEATSSLICYIDTGTGLAITPDGNNIDINWGVAGIFGL